MKRGYRYFIDIEILVNICKILQISLYQLQENIVAYKTRRGGNHIEKPKLPIEITPIFDMLIAHHIGDGNVVNPKRGRMPYFSYKQFDNKYRNLYISKIESVFGKLNYKNKYFDREGQTQIYFPVAVSNLLFTFYNLDVQSFKSLTARIPKEIFHKNWKHKLAFLIGIIVDEGSVDSTLIVVGMKNEEIIKDLGMLCNDLEYSYSIRKGKTGMFHLYIHSLKKFYQDYLTLLNEYPEVHLGYKGKKIEQNFKISERSIKRVPGNRKIILEMLSKEKLSVNEIAIRILMTRQGVRYHIRKLEQQEKITRISTVEENNYIYVAV
tara:strand:- start:1441 stop:2406 length:966 start_codon:yes stop_codon:yes gene_type:complete